MRQLLTSVCRDTDVEVTWVKAAVNLLHNQFPASRHILCWIVWHVASGSVLQFFCVSAEGFQSWMWRGLTFLLPFLFFGHVSLHFTCISLEIRKTLHIKMHFKSAFVIGCVLKAFLRRRMGIKGKEAHAVGSVQRHYERECLLFLYSFGSYTTRWPCFAWQDMKTVRSGR